MSGAPPMRHPEAGFTLIELLVAVTLLALLTVVLFGGLRIATRSGDAVAQRVADARQIALAYDFMTNELAAAQPLKASSDANAPVDFAGEPDALSFVALLPPDIGVGGFFRLRAALVENRPGDGRLIVTSTPWPRPGAEPIAYNAQPSILLDGLRSIAFAYFGTPVANQPPLWNDRWAEHHSLPQLIRLRIVLADGAQMPDLIVAPRLAGPAAP